MLSIFIKKSLFLSTLSATMSPFIKFSATLPFFLPNHVGACCLVHIGVGVCDVWNGRWQRLRCWHWWSKDVCLLHWGRTLTACDAFGHALRWFRHNALFSLVACSLWLPVPRVSTKQQNGCPVSAGTQRVILPSRAGMDMWTFTYCFVCYFQLSLFLYFLFS